MLFADLLSLHLVTFLMFSNSCIYTHVDTRTQSPTHPTPTHQHTHSLTHTHTHTHTHSHHC